MLPISEYQKLALRDVPFTNTYFDWIKSVLWPFMFNTMKRHRGVKILNEISVNARNLTFVLDMGNGPIEVNLDFQAGSLGSVFWGYVESETRRQKLPVLKFEYGETPASMAKTLAVNYIIGNALGVS